MSAFDALLARLQAWSSPVRDGILPPALTLDLPASFWSAASACCADAGARLSALWGDLDGDEHIVRVLLECERRHLLLRCRQHNPSFASWTLHYPNANRPERHAADLLGLRFTDHPDPRRWTRHQAWSANDHPLRPDFPVEGRLSGPALADSAYPFITAQGAGVHEIPVGPIHAGIIEPGHFRFLAVGEEVLNLEERLGYVHKGIEKIAVGRDAAGLLRLAGRVSGDSTVAHGWAAAQAIERLAGLDLPPRALHLRGLLAERERVANHLGDIAAICNDVGFAFAYHQLMRLKEDWLRANAAVFGHRLLMDRLCIGGVCNDPDADVLRAMAEHAATIQGECERIIHLLEHSDSLEDRLMTTGRLTPELARRLGTIGYVGRASGLAFDLRRHAPYPPYDSLEVRVPTYRAGDVAARAKVRAEEAGVSLGLIRHLIATLPRGPVCLLPGPLPAGEGLGLIEGWRGETVAYVRLGDDGRVLRYFPRDPSWLSWPALERLIHGNIVPDFPVCNKSINGSYSGQDL